MQLHCFNRRSSLVPRILLMLTALATVAAPSALAAPPRVAVLSTEFVLQHKLELMKQAATQAGVDMQYVQVDHATDQQIARALAGAALVIQDLPRSDDQSLVETKVGSRVRDAKVPVLNVMVMSPPRTVFGVGMSSEVTESLFKYYTNGTPANYTRMFRYITRAILKTEKGEVLPPIELPAMGVWYPSASEVFPTLDAYLAWLKTKGRFVSDETRPPVIGVEISSSNIADGQLRMLEDFVTRIEHAGGLPVMFYRNPRGGRRGPADGAGASTDSTGGGRGGGGGGRGGGGRGGKGAPAEAVAPTAGTVAAAPPSGSPNARQFGMGNSLPEAPQAPGIEPLIQHEGRRFVDLMINSMFLGSDPEVRKKEYEKLGLPAMQLLSYRDGDEQAYLKDKAGVSSFQIPYSLTTAEYIGLMDPMVGNANHNGELIPIPYQMDAIINKAMNLVSLQRKKNHDKKIALYFWNHPPGDKNQSASHLNVPRSIVALANRMRDADYNIKAFNEDETVEAVGTMQRPVYRRGELPALMKSGKAAFLPLSVYEKWYATLPASVRKEVEDFFGPPAKSPWITTRNGQQGFAIPRYEVGNLVIMPQPLRGEIADESEKKLFHDTKIPLNHYYMASYLWTRQQFHADAIIHFGTHGTQEWTPGKERGLWVYDDPLILIADTPIVYPYIVDNISEAVHVKRRGRGVIVSHQTPPFAPAGLADDLLALNDRLREYEATDDGLVKESARKLIVEQVVKLNIHADMKWSTADIGAKFPEFLEELADYLEDLGAEAQPLGLHTLGEPASDEHVALTVMQSLGQPLYEHLGVKDAKQAFAGDYRSVTQTKPYQFVNKYAMGSAPLDELTDPKLRDLATQGRTYAANLKSMREIEGVLDALAGRYIETSYGGDPIRNPDALPTGRNMYGFDPSRVPTPTAYEAGKQAIENLVTEYRKTHNGAYPQKLTFSVWSSETMRHMGMLEGEILYAIGARPTWDRGGRVTGMEVVPRSELKRPRIDAVISIVGLYRDQFPNVMEKLNEAIVKVAAMDEPDNQVRLSTQKVKKTLLAKGVPEATAEEFALTRIFGNESGDYSTKLTDATLASDQWEGDAKLAALYLSRMSWGYGPNTSNWSSKLKDASGNELNAYAEHLRGTSAAVFSRSSNLHGMLDTDHPFEYLGGIALAVRSVDGTSPQLYISNMRDPARAKLETAEKFLATDLRTTYQHPNWVSEMKKEGYAGTLQLLDAVNNFWGWTAVDKDVVRDDQWQEFHDVYVKDKYNLGLRDWFEANNASALASIDERMLEAVRKGAWKTDEATVRDLVENYADLSNRHDIVSNNLKFTEFVASLAAGYGIEMKQGPVNVSSASPQTSVRVQRASLPRWQNVNKAIVPPSVRGQVLRQVTQSPASSPLVWAYALGVLLIIFSGSIRAAFRQL